MSDHKRPEDGWLEGFLDGELSESESRELADWLRSDERGLREWVDAMLFEQQIRAAVVAREQQAAFQPIGASTLSDMATDRGLLNRSSSHRRARDRWAFWSLLSLIAALTVAAATGWGGDLRRLAHALRLIPAHSRKEAKRPSESAGAPARTTPSQTSSLPTTNNEPSPNRADARSAISGQAGAANRFCRVVWVARAKGNKGGLSANETTVVAPGDRLGSGHVRLVAGTAELLFDSGVRVICTGPADLELRGPSHAWLHAGEAVFRVPPAAIGFKLETKEAVIVDLGTEFGVRAENVDGPNTGAGTELQVYEGEVLANTKPGNTGAVVVPRRVVGGQALRIGDEASGGVQELPFRPERFVHEMPDPSDHPEAAMNGLPKKSPYNKPRHDSIRIMPAPRNVSMDGSLAEWDLSGRFAGECPPPWNEFYNVQGALMYDSVHLYIGAIVADPFPLRSTVSPKPDRELYGGGGSVVLRLSADRSIGWPVTARVRALAPQREYLDEDRNERLASLVMWYYAAESLPCLDLRYGIDFHGRKVNPEGFRGAWKKRTDGLGYTMEYAIPWSLLNVADNPPQGGDTLACTFLVHWSDPAGQNWRGQLIEIVNSKAHGWNFENAATWGRAIYVPSSIR